jgi:hypothetical protein
MQVGIKENIFVANAAGACNDSMMKLVPVTQNIIKFNLIKFFIIIIYVPSQQLQGQL